MSTEQSIEQYLKDPLSMPDDMLDGLTAIQNDGEQIEGQQPGSQPVIENNGDTAGAAPGTDDQAAKKGDGTPATPSADAKPEPDPTNAVVKSKDGKHEIPYTVLAQERENRIRAERMAQDLTEQLTVLQHAKETGAAVK